MTEQHQEVSFEVNGQVRRMFVPVSDTLLHTLRRRLGLTGAKPGCENGDCGACTVLVDDSPYKSCIMLTVEAEGSHITTVEGLCDAPIQRAFLRHFAFQCGYCTPGFLMNAHALTLRAAKESVETTTDLVPIGDFDATMREWLESNICRCTSYEEIGAAVREAVYSTRRDDGTGNIGTNHRQTGTAGWGDPP